MKCVICEKEVGEQSEELCEECKKQKCSLCNGPIMVDYDGGSIYCGRCGIIGNIILKKIIDLTYRDLIHIQNKWIENSQIIRDQIKDIYKRFAKGKTSYNYKQSEIIRRFNPVEDKYYHEIYIKDRLLYSKDFFIFGDWVDNEFKELIKFYQETIKKDIRDRLFGGINGSN